MASTRVTRSTTAKSTSTIQTKNVVTSSASPSSSKVTLDSDDDHEDEPPVKRRKVNPKSKTKKGDGEDASPCQAPKKVSTRRKASAALDSDGPPPARVISPWKVGAHVSSAGGVHNAVINASRIRANAFALFLKSQRKWTSPPLMPLVVEQFKKLVVEHGFDPKKDVLPHGSYLINLGNPDAEKRAKSMECFVDDLKRCEEVGVRLYNFHPGSSVGHPPAVAIQHIIDSLNEAHNLTPDSDVMTVIENMAGAGSVIGGRFEDIGEIVKGVERKDRVGVCLDTCHMFAAGYDIRTKQGWDGMLVEFDKHIGLQYLVAMHLNDSKEALGSKKDRHENIGLGHIGLTAFYHVVNDPRTQGIPLILETPTWEREEIWETEIKVLNSLSRLPPSVDTANGVEEASAGGAEVATAEGAEEATAEGAEEATAEGAEVEEEVDMQLLESKLEEIRAVANAAGGDAKKGKAKAKGDGAKGRKKRGQEAEEEGDEGEETDAVDSTVLKGKGRKGGTGAKKEVASKGRGKSNAGKARVESADEGDGCASHDEDE